MFIEEYREAWGWEEPFDEGTFLSTVLANSWAAGYSNWLGIGHDPNAKVRHWISELGICFEDRVVASIMDGSAEIWVDDEQIPCEGLWDKWVNMLNEPTDEVKAILEDFKEGDDDAITADCLLQYWLCGEVVFG